MVSEPVGTWTRRVRWDDSGRLLAAWGQGAGAPAGTWAFAYDHSGERVLKYRIGDGQMAGATLYLRDEQGNVLSEMQWVDTGTAGYWARAKDHVYLGRDLLGSFDRSTGEPHVVSYARDHLGSQRAEVWGLDTRTATDLWPYGALARTKAAGAPPALANGAHLFTGHEREYTGSEALADPLMGLDYMHARYYAFNLGRFMSVDPVGGKPGLSQSWNRYAYVRGNPVGAVDRDGREGLGALIGLAGGAIKAAYENIKMATQRPVTNKELFKNLVANLVGGTITGATAGLGSGVVGGAVMGGAGGLVGGMAKRSLDPETMNTRVLDRGAMKADLVGGAVGGAVGGLATGGAHLAQSGRVAAVKMESAVARAAAAEDRSLAALAHATEKKATSVIQEVARNSEAVGGVVGSSTAEGVAGTVNQPGDPGLRARHRHKETQEY